MNRTHGPGRALLVVIKREGQEGPAPAGFVEGPDVHAAVDDPRRGGDSRELSVRLQTPIPELGAVGLGQNVEPSVLSADVDSAIGQSWRKCSPHVGVAPLERPGSLV